MLRRLVLLLVALWAVRVARLLRPRPPHASGFGPADGAPHPARDPASAPKEAFAAGEIVDADFEDITPRRAP
jgi:hypothetical protein